LSDPEHPIRAYQIMKVFGADRVFLARVRTALTREHRRGRSSCLVEKLTIFFIAKPTFRTPAAVRNFVRDCVVQTCTIRSCLAAADDFFEHAVADLHYFNLARLKIAASSSGKAVNNSSACTTKRFPSSRCASAIQIVRPWESIAETQPQLQPALGIVDHLGRWFARFKLRAHLLNLRGLLSELGRESLYLFLLLRDRCFQLLNFANFAIEHGGALGLGRTRG
jgi:hypothetical protein